MEASTSSGGRIGGKLVRRRLQRKANRNLCRNRRGAARWGARLRIRAALQEQPDAGRHQQHGDRRDQLHPARHAGQLGRGQQRLEARDAEVRVDRRRSDQLPTQIANEVAATNIAPGQELTSADFATGTVSLSQYLTGGQRALEIPVDSTHGLAGYVVQGQRIDLGTTTGAQTGSNCPAWDRPAGDQRARAGCRCERRQPRA